MKERILVINTAASKTGAESVMHSFYDNATKRKDVDFVIVIGNLDLKPLDNVKIIKVPWTKKSWFFRFFFDLFIIPLLAIKIKPTKIFSLENVCFPLSGCKQFVFVHQPLYFSNFRIKRKESFILWFYQNIIARWSYFTLRYADRLIVQTQSMKTAIIEKQIIDAEKISVSFPAVDGRGYKFKKQNYRTFFFPATPLLYKNHRVIFAACDILLGKGITDFEIRLTIDKDSIFYKNLKNPNTKIKFLGTLSREDVFKEYENSILLFPSYIESFGYPLAEARTVGSPIIAANTPFAQELLDGYKNAYFFNYDSPIELASIMERFIKNEIIYNDIPTKIQCEKDYWGEIMDIII